MSLLCLSLIVLSDFALIYLILYLNIKLKFYDSILIKGDNNND